MPEQSFLFLCSQHCYGDFKQDGGAIPTHHSRCSSPPCTDRMSSPFPRKRERPGKEEGGGGLGAGALHLPGGATPQQCRDGFSPSFCIASPPPSTPHTPSPGSAYPSSGTSRGCSSSPVGGVSAFCTPQAPQRASPLSLHPLRIRSIPLSPRI